MNDTETEHNTPLLKETIPDDQKCNEIGLWLMRAMVTRRISHASVIINCAADKRFHSELPVFLHEQLRSLHHYTEDGDSKRARIASWADTPYCMQRSGGSQAEYEAEFAQLSPLFSDFKANIVRWLNDFTPQHLLPVNDTWYRNLRALEKVLALSPAEAEILRYSVACHLSPLLQCVETRQSFYSAGTATDHCRTLGDLFSVSDIQIRTCLAPGGVLLRSSLLSFKYSIEGSTKLEVDESLLNAILTGTPETLFSGFFLPATATQLAESDFAYCEDHLSVVRTYLRHALETKQKGVNILLYGRPGVGKSELAKVMAQALGMPLYQVAEENEDKSAKDRDSRLTAYCLTQEVRGGGHFYVTKF
jgi:hypothetical protein